MSVRFAETGQNVVAKCYACPACGGCSFQDYCETLQCERCNKTYKVVLGIPALVSDFNLLDQEMENARAVKPDWYEVAQAEELESPWRHHLRKRRLYVEKVIKRYLVETSRDRVNVLLDLGCGDGANLSYLSKYCDKLLGVDYNILRLKRARYRAAASSMLLSRIVPSLSIKESSIDLIFFNHVLEHIKEDETALSEVYRVLKPGGLLILGIPNEGCFWWQLAYKLEPEMLKTSDHVQFYTLGSISDKVKRAGFIIKETKRLGWGLPHWTLDQKVRRYKFMNDLLDGVGKLVFPSQCSSLYVAAIK